MKNSGPESVVPNLEPPFPEDDYGLLSYALMYPDGPPFTAIEQIEGEVVDDKKEEK